jgi:DNA segregation ATPase FtsK/SpoIIIE-like protein
MTDKKSKRKYTIELPEETIEKLEKYAANDGEKPEEVIQDMLEWYYFGERDFETDDSLLFEAIIPEVIKQEIVSGSFIQRSFSVTFSRARKILSQLEKMGYIEKANGYQPQKVIRKKAIS